MSNVFCAEIYNRYKVYAKTPELAMKALANDIYFCGMITSKDKLFIKLLSDNGPKDIKNSFDRVYRSDFCCYEVEKNKDSELILKEFNQMIDELLMKEVIT